MTGGQVLYPTVGQRVELRNQGKESGTVLMVHRDVTLWDLGVQVRSVTVQTSPTEVVGHLYWFASEDARAASGVSEQAPYCVPAATMPAAA